MVYANSGGDVGEAFGGVFYELELSRRFFIHNKLVYRPVYVNYSLFNQDVTCQFCPVRKIGSIGIDSFSFQVLPQVTLVNLDWFKLNIFAGVNTSFNFVIDSEPIELNEQPGVSLVINSLESGVKPVSYSFAYGGSIEVWRILFWAKFLPKAQYSKTIEISGKNYNFKNSWEFVSFSIGYKLYGFGKNNSKEL